MATASGPHVGHMERAVHLARSARGTTSPNPSVGAIIVKDGVVLGEGWTSPPGGPHAEIVALGQAGPAAAGAVLYSTMEPCCIWGRTPPCTDAIVAAGISQVYAATIDPNPRVAGKGLEALRKSGIVVTCGTCEDQALEMYEAFAKHIRTGLPFVTAKFGASLDGKIATRTGSSRWVTGEASREHAHDLRRGCDAIMAGVNTIVVDNPQLTARWPDGALHSRQPLRVVLDSSGRTPPDASILSQPGETLIVTVDMPADRAAVLEAAGARVLTMPGTSDGQVDIPRLLEHLGKEGVVDLIVEGGGALLGSMFDADLVDKVTAYIAPLIIGGSSAPSPVGGRGAEDISQALRLTRTQVETLGEDLLITGYPSRPDQPGQ